MVTVPHGNVAAELHENVDNYPAAQVKRGEYDRGGLFRKLVEVPRWRAQELRKILLPVSKKNNIRLHCHMSKVR